MLNNLFKGDCDKTNSIYTNLTLFNMEILHIAINDSSRLIIKRRILPWFISTPLNLQMIITKKTIPATSRFRQLHSCLNATCIVTTDVLQWNPMGKLLILILTDNFIAITNWYICLTSTAKHNTQTGRPLPRLLPFTIQDYVFKSAFYLLP